MNKTTILNKLKDILDGGELNTLAEATTDMERTTVEIAGAQGYLEGVVKTAQELAGVTKEEINALDIVFEVDTDLTNWELIHHLFF